MTASFDDKHVRSPRVLLAGFVLFAAAAIFLWPDRVSGLAAFDFEGPVFFDPGKSVKDHSIIFADGTFHLYYITTDQRSFGYATSPDLRHWTVHGDILHAGPDQWDSAYIWAPCVVYYPYEPGYFLMYYTGVNNAMAQRTCLAWSHITSLWGKASGAVFIPFHGDTTWLNWSESEWSNYRDPGFFRENGVCYLVHTAQTRGGNGAIALAQSSDYFHWADAGPLYVHNNWHAVESPFLMKRNGVYHLFFTEEGVGGVSHMSSDSLRSGWNIATRSIIDGGHAAEVLDLGSDRYVISRHTSYSSSAGPVSSIRFDTLGWNGDAPEVKMTKPLEGWTVLWGAAFDHQPVFGNNPRYRGDDTTNVGFEGNWWIGTYEAFNGPLTGTTPGAIQGDGARGAIRSADFVVTGYSMRLLVGGGFYPDSCYVALCDARTNEVLRRETGSGSDRLEERIWDLYPLRGRMVHLLIVDNCSSPFGHINVDGIEERSTAVGPAPDDGDHTLTPDTRKKHLFLESVSSAARSDGSRVGASIAGRPNPFNPTTSLEIQTTPNTQVTIVIFDVTGRRVRSSRVTTDARGRSTIQWDGRNAYGRDLPSAVYIAVLKDAQRRLASCKLVLAR